MDQSFEEIEQTRQGLGVDLSNESNGLLKNN